MAFEIRKGSANRKKIVEIIAECLISDERPLKIEELGEFIRGRISSALLNEDIQKITPLNDHGFLIKINRNFIPETISREEIEACFLEELEKPRDQEEWEADALFARIIDDTEVGERIFNFLQEKMNRRDLIKFFLWADDNNIFGTQLWNEFIKRKNARADYNLVNFALEILSTL